MKSPSAMATCHAPTACRRVLEASASTKAIHDSRRSRRQRPLRSRRSRRRARHAVSTPFGAPSGPLLERADRRGAPAVPAAARAAGTGSRRRRSTTAPTSTRSSSRGDAGAVGLGGRLAARGDAARRPGPRRPVHRQDLPAGVDLLRRRRRRPRQLRRADLRGVRAAVAEAAAETGVVEAPAAARLTAQPRGSGEAPPPRRHLRLHGGAAVLDARRVAAAPQLGRRRSSA